MKIIGMIPVRLESSRLPQKAIADICGMPMILHTMKRSQMAGILDEVYVVTDSEMIRELIEKNGGKVLMTSSSHQTGTDRIAEAAEKIDADIIVNVQGDEALVDPEHIEAGVRALLDSDASVSILVRRFSVKKSPSDIKAVLNMKNEIMYLSRADIPSDARTEVKEMLKAYHVVSFRKPFLLQYNRMKRTPLEQIEYNEYLRILENGYKIQAALVDSDAISVDTKGDLELVRKKMKTDALYQKYKPK
ncbi:MAG: 3-deoxy-manno-octulosonate cytidylyltransferase [archaeon]|nr:3-deoxy-manno-octulosonate cytidylyltransferase [Candidatus Micrarchaeota archaeon]MBU1887024.1 3-deoxy-manno-octulosonate cytidylyltransferase [Candidatus Micrarchaeota archaeon]